jgi:hypothetical protein
LDLGHTHSVTKSNELGGNQHPYNYGEYSNPGSTALGYANIGDPSTDGSNGTPRTGKTTDPRALGAIPYIWGYTYSV